MLSLRGSARVTVMAPVAFAPGGGAPARLNASPTTQKPLRAGIFAPRRAAGRASAHAGARGRTDHTQLQPTRDPADTAPPPQRRRPFPAQRQDRKRRANAERSRLGAGRHRTPVPHLRNFPCKDPASSGASPTVEHMFASGSNAQLSLFTPVNPHRATPRAARACHDRSAFCSSVSASGDRLLHRRRPGAGVARTQPCLHAQAAAAAPAKQ